MREWLDTRQAAEYLGLSPETLESWRCRDAHGMTFYKLGAKVLYDKADLDSWLDERRVDGGDGAADDLLGNLPAKRWS